VTANPSGPAVIDACLWPLAYWDCGFKTHQGHGCRACGCSVVEEEASATGRPLVQNPTECGVYGGDRVTSWSPRPSMAVDPWGIKNTTT